MAALTPVPAFLVARKLLTMNSGVAGLTSQGLPLVDRLLILLMAKYAWLSEMSSVDGKSSIPMFYHTK